MGPNKEDGLGGREGEGVCKIEDFKRAVYAYRRRRFNERCEGVLSRKQKEKERGRRSV